jgi:transcriptional regulator with XRE-family HTH domain
MTNGSPKPDQSVTDEEARRLAAADFARNLVAQLVKLRTGQGLTQTQLAERLGTKQQAISRLEDPMYDRPSLRMLRRLGDVFDAFVEVIYVPRSKLDTYLEYRYLPVLDDAPPTQPHGEHRRGASAPGYGRRAMAQPAAPSAGSGVALTTTVHQWLADTAAAQQVGLEALAGELLTLALSNRAAVDQAVEIIRRQQRGGATQMQTRRLRSTIT